MKINAIVPLALLALLMGRRSSSSAAPASTDVGKLRTAEQRARRAGDAAAANQYAAQAEAAEALHRANSILETP
jgi:hypothetical protein